VHYHVLPVQAQIQQNVPAASQDIHIVIHQTVALRDQLVKERVQFALSVEVYSQEYVKHAQQQIVDHAIH